jgi:uncharacterized protein (TIGR02453 family)
MPRPRTPHFSPELFAFLDDLRRNNDRAWFAANKPRFVAHVKEAAMRFIGDFSVPLAKISPRYVADPRPVGGSLLRIHKDTRFARDKSPYKTNVGIQFRHEAGKDIHAPGYYLHLAPEEIFAGVGLWHPDPAALAQIRDGIVERPDAWSAAIRAKGFAARFERGGESLKRPPAGYDPSHPFVDDLKRKDHIAMARFTADEACAPDFLERFAKTCAAASAFMGFLTAAVGLPF